MDAKVHQKLFRGDLVNIFSEELSLLDSIFEEFKVKGENGISSAHFPMKFNDSFTIRFKKFEAVFGIPVSLMLFPAEIHTGLVPL